VYNDEEMRLPHKLGLAKKNRGMLQRENNGITLNPKFKSIDSFSSIESKPYRECLRDVGRKPEDSSVLSETSVISLCEVGKFDATKTSDIGFN
jgi:hypothetical protein